MKRLLYITVNSKPETLSSSKTVGRLFVNEFLKKNPDFKLEELDLYKCHIPRLEYQYFEQRNCMVGKAAYDKLDKKSQEEFDKIVKLVDQFVEADVYVIAAPMWSLSFPAPLKEYIDCIVMDKKTINVKEKEKPDPLLNDKKRGAVYIQSSGASLNVLTKMIMNKGLSYVEDIFKFMGIETFEELLVDGTGTTEEERIQAIEKAKGKIDEIVEKIY